MNRITLLVLSLCLLSRPAAAIPATPLMTVYQFDGPLTVPYYDVDRFLRDGPTTPAGSLTQGTSVIPCLVIRADTPVTDGDGTPYVGFQIVVDANEATPASSTLFTDVAAQRQEMAVSNHHCPDGTEHVIDVRKLAVIRKPPRFDPPRPAAPATAQERGLDDLDAIVRAFHASRECERANLRLVERRDSLRRAWSSFIDASKGRWPAPRLAQARQLDFVMRTALYEGDLNRGCSAYGACERNVIALSIRNRSLERCLRGQGCDAPGDFEGVATAVSQYNIWDETLTQTTGVSSCFLRPDLAEREHQARLQAMYAQSVADVERILFHDTSGLQQVFPENRLSSVTGLRHYYHPPAMGKCFPDQKRLEYISGAVARRGDAFALIANTRIAVGEPQGRGYLFQQATIEDDGERDIVKLSDQYPGFVIDGRKVQLEPPSRCAPYGVPPGCRFATVGRHRKTPSWLSSGSPLQLTCRIRARGESCRGDAVLETIKVGGTCDIRMQPVAGVP